MTVAAQACLGLVLSVQVIAWNCAGIASPLIIQVAPHFSQAPATIRVRVRLVPVASDRILAIVVDGPSYSRESERSLSGEQAARFYEWYYEDLPPGEYVIIATVGGNAGIRARAQGSAVVLGE